MFGASFLILGNCADKLLDIDKEKQNIATWKIFSDLLLTVCKSFKWKHFFIKSDGKAFVFNKNVMDFFCRQKSTT